MGKLKDKFIERFKGMTVKSYLKETNEFFKTHLKKPFITLSIIALLVIVIGLQSSVSLVQTGDLGETTLKNLTFKDSFVSNVQILLVIVLAGIVPYMYVPGIGALAYVCNELMTIAYLIVNVGYLKAILTYILPLIINICIANLAASLGIYICKTITNSYKLSNMKHMNSTNFMIELYNIIKNDKKKQNLEDKKNKKLKALESKNKKVDYFELFNVGIILVVLQIIASLISSIAI